MSRLLHLYRYLSQGSNPNRGESLVPLQEKEERYVRCRHFWGGNGSTLSTQLPEAGTNSKSRCSCGRSGTECGRWGDPVWNEERMGLEASKEWSRIHDSRQGSVVWRGLFSHRLVRQGKSGALFCRVRVITPCLECPLRS